MISLNRSQDVEQRELQGMNQEVRYLALNQGNTERYRDPLHKQRRRKADGFSSESVKLVLRGVDRNHTSPHILVYSLIGKTTGFYPVVPRSLLGGPTNLLKHKKPLQSDSVMAAL